jgi:hypothetical protein
MKNLHRFVPTIKLIFAFAFLFFKEHPSISCEKITEPEVRRIYVAGANEFASQVDPYLKMSGKKLLLFDLHGVLTRNSLPPNHECLPRGDMVDFVKYVASDQFPDVEVLVLSAWDVFTETVHQAKFLGLTGTLKMCGEIIEGEITVEGVVYEYARLGNLISVREKKNKEGTITLTETATPKRKYYFHKAIGPLVAFGLNCQFDILGFIDDSTENVKLFLNLVKSTPYYTKLKTLLLFDIPTIAGEIRTADQIPCDLLPDEYRSKPLNQLPLEFAIPEKPVKLVLPLFANSNPLARSGFYPAGGSDSDDEKEAIASYSTVSSAADSSVSSSLQPIISSLTVDLSTASDHSHAIHIPLSRSAEICRFEEGNMLQRQEPGGRVQLTKSH